MTWYQDFHNAKQYHEKNHVLNMARQHREFLTRLPVYNQKNTQSILDLGMGTGRDLKKFRSLLNYNVFGIEQSHEMADVGGVLDYSDVVIGDMLDTNTWDFLDQDCYIFDGVWAMASLIYFNEQQLEFIIKSVHRRLKYLGVFFISVPYTSSVIENKLDNKGMMLYKYHQQKWIDMLEHEDRFYVDYVYSGVSKNNGWQWLDIAAICK